MSPRKALALLLCLAALLGLSCGQQQYKPIRQQYQYQNVYRQYPRVSARNLAPGPPAMPPQGQVPLPSLPENIPIGPPAPGPNLLASGLPDRKAH